MSYRQKFRNWLLRKLEAVDRRQCAEFCETYLTPDAKAINSTEAMASYAPGSRGPFIIVGDRVMVANTTIVRRDSDRVAIAVAPWCRDVSVIGVMILGPDPVVEAGLRQVGLRLHPPRLPVEGESE